MHDLFINHEPIMQHTIYSDIDPVHLNLHRVRKAQPLESSVIFYESLQIHSVSIAICENTLHCTSSASENDLQLTTSNIFMIYSPFAYLSEFYMYVDATVISPVDRYC